MASLIAVSSAAVFIFVIFAISTLVGEQSITPRPWILYLLFVRTPVRLAQIVLYMIHGPGYFCGVPGCWDRVYPYCRAERKSCFRHCPEGHRRIYGCGPGRVIELPQARA